MNKKIKKSLKNFGKTCCVGLLTAGMIALTLTPLTAKAGTTVTGSNTSKLTNLGECGKYAVFANSVNIKCDMEGNVAGRNASFNGVHIGLTYNVEGFKSSYIEKFNNVYGCSELLKMAGGTDTLVIGDNYGIKNDTRDRCWWITENGRNIFKIPLSHVNNLTNIRNSIYKINFENCFTDMKLKAASLKKLTTSTVDLNLGNNFCRNGRVFCKGKTNVVNMTMAQYNAMYDFNIILPFDASLVINIVDYNGQNLDNKVTINGIRPTYKGLAGRVLWNFGCYAGTVSFGETTQGVILAPCAKVAINSTHNGNIIADTVTNPGGEIHKNDFTGVFPGSCDNVCTSSTCTR